MSNPSQRARIARMPLHELNPACRAIGHQYGFFSARIFIIEVMTVDGKPAAQRGGFVALEPDPTSGNRIKRTPIDQALHDTLEKVEQHINAQGA